MILKLKALIYRVTGIYLAHKEELEYITSEDACQRMELDLFNKDNDMLLYNLQGLYIGLWQAEHGFCRKYKC